MIYYSAPNPERQSRKRGCRLAPRLAQAARLVYNGENAAGRRAAPEKEQTNEKMVR